MPVIGFLRTPGRRTHSRIVCAAFRQGLKRAGLCRGPECCDRISLGGGSIDRLPELAADLVRRQVAVIVATGSAAAALAAKAATTTIPIVFVDRRDPVKLGLVASLNRPGGNVTGVSMFERRAWRQSGWNCCTSWCPSGDRIAVLVNPDNPRDGSSPRCRRWRPLAPLGVQLDVFNAQHRARNRCGLRNACATSGPTRSSSAATPFSTVGASQLVDAGRAPRDAGGYSDREFAEAGGLMSYGTNIPRCYRQVGVYAGRILKGEKPADLPVVQPTKFELVINLKTAKALGLDVPPTLLARADEVIE